MKSRANCTTSRRCGATVEKRLIHGLPCQPSRHRERRDEAEQDRRADPASKLAAGDQREDAERRDGVGHQPMDEAEPHGLAPVGATGAEPERVPRRRGWLAVRRCGAFGGGGARRGARPRR